MSLAATAQQDDAARMITPFSRHSIVRPSDVLMYPKRQHIRLGVGPQRLLTPNLFCPAWKLYDAVSYLWFPLFGFSVALLFSLLPPLRLSISLYFSLSLSLFPLYLSLPPPPPSLSFARSEEAAPPPCTYSSRGTSGCFTLTSTPILT